MNVRMSIATAARDDKEVVHLERDLPKGCARGHRGVVHLPTLPLRALISAYSRFEYVAAHTLGTAGITM